MRAWVIVVSTVVGALAGFVTYFLWISGPWPKNMWWVMAACAAMGGLFAISFLLPWPWQGEDGRGDDGPAWPWPDDADDDR